MSIMIQNIKTAIVLGFFIVGAFGGIMFLLWWGGLIEIKFKKHYKN